MPDIAIALGFSLALLLSTTALHYRVVVLLEKLRPVRSDAQHPWLFAATASLVGAHLVQICLYAFAFAAASLWLGLGTFEGVHEMRAFDYFYFAAETYSSLGYGDIYPSGALRLIASICPLNGLLLLAWSGAFLVSLADHLRRS